MSFIPTTPKLEALIYDMYVKAGEACKNAACNYISTIIRFVFRLGTVNEILRLHSY